VRFLIFVWMGPLLLVTSTEAFQTAFHPLPSLQFSRGQRYHRRLLGTTLWYGSDSDSSDPTPEQAEAWHRRAVELLAEAKEMEEAVRRHKDEQVHKQDEDIDEWVHHLFPEDEVAQATIDKDTEQWTRAVDRLAKILLKERFSPDQVMMVLDRLTEIEDEQRRQHANDTVSSSPVTSGRRLWSLWKATGQDTHSRRTTEPPAEGFVSACPRIQLLLAAVNRLDCLDDCENHRWNHHVEHDLRRKLIAHDLGVGLSNPHDEPMPNKDK